MCSRSELSSENKPILAGGAVLCHRTTPALCRNCGNNLEYSGRALPKLKRGGREEQRKSVQKQDVRSYPDGVNG